MRKYILIIFLVVAGFSAGYCQSDIEYKEYIDLVKKSEKITHWKESSKLANDDFFYVPTTTSKKNEIVISVSTKREDVNFYFTIDTANKQILRDSTVYLR